MKTLAQDCKDRIMSEDYADFMFDFGETLEDIASQFDVCYTGINFDTAAVYMPVGQVPSNLIHMYGYGVFPNLYGLLDIAAIEASGITRVRNIPALNLLGSGVLIGVIDTGIEYTHDTFKNADGTSKIYAIWDQTIVSERGMPEGFQFGTEYKKEQINQALASENPLSVVPSTDENGHGTFLAGIAAGNRSEENDFSGVVPGAELVVVKLKPAKRWLKDFWKVPQDTLCYQKNDFMFAINYLVQTARNAGRPMAILVGIGTSQGAHDDRGALSRYLTTVAGMNGITVSIAGGNEGNSRHHCLGSVSGTGDFDTVELNVGRNVSGFSMEFWGSTPGTFSIDIISPSGESSSRILARLNETRIVRFIFEATIIYVDYQLVEAQSGEQLILVRFDSPTEGIWRFRVYASGGLALSYHVWLPITQFLNEETFFVNSNPYTTLTSPGNTIIPIVTTAYDHINQNLYINSSRGFMRTEGIAPSLTAPGVNVIGPALNNGYTTLSGTSISAAHMAGITAMFLEWGIVRNNYPNISTIEIRNLLIRGAKRAANLTYPNREWGYGIVDIFNAYNILRGGT